MWTIAHDVIDAIRYAAVFQGKDMVMLYARPADARPWTGDVFAARVTRYLPGQRAYFLDLGNGVDAFLPHKNAAEFSGGDSVTVRIERPATTRKNIRCSLIGKTDAAIGRLTAGDDVVAQAQRDFPDATLSEKGLQDFDATIIALQEKGVACGNGLELVIEETEALTAIDINSADPALKPFDANRLALGEIARQMRLRNLSGQILIDCLRVQKADQRHALHESFAEAVNADPRKVDLYGFTRLGLFELTRMRDGLSLAEIARLMRA